MDAAQIEKILHGFNIDLGSNQNKIIPVAEAIKKFIHPMMHIHTSISHAIPYGLCNELIRQFHGSNPKFIISCMGAVNHVLCLVHSNLVKKIITTYAGDIYPAPAPNRIYDERWKAGMEIEEWSVLTFIQRLIAGALGVGFFPTNSLQNTTMADTNSKNGTYAQISNPFRPNMSQAVVSPLQPDVALIHGWLSDHAGNIILTSPLSETPWSVYAAKKVIVSVEKIVDTEVIRRMSHMVRIPSFMVDAVCELPFGCHPGGLTAQGLDPALKLKGYAEDYDYIVQFRHKTKENSTLDHYIKEWILDCPTQQVYLAKLGNEHLQELQKRADPNYWREDIKQFFTTETLTNEMIWTPSEMMSIVAGRIMGEICQTKNYTTILAGQGASNLAAWMAMYHLQTKGYDLNLLAELGFIGYAPRPGSPFIFNFANIPSCRMTADAFTTMGCFVGGPKNKCLGALGCAQIDIEGNINSTLVRTPNGHPLQYIVGSGGANDVMSGAKETIIVTNSKGGPLRFVQNVPYIMGRGTKIDNEHLGVTVLVTDQAVFRKQDNHLVLTQLISPNPNETNIEKLLKTVKKNTGWRPFETILNPTLIEAPSQDELTRVRLFDPRKNFLR